MFHHPILLEVMRARLAIGDETSSTVRAPVGVLENAVNFIVLLESCPVSKHVLSTLPETLQIAERLRNMDDYFIPEEFPVARRRHCRSLLVNGKANPTATDRVREVCGYKKLSFYMKLD
mmetsp:Transcript_47596/g.83751  ORF Transcript_47596/g.83751 Transcript_47596/m.83751 type:complete len:119 (+) Transcript_47596:898-1254(+)